MGCRYSTPEPHRSEIASAKPPAPSHPTLLEHFSKNGGDGAPQIPLDSGNPAPVVGKPWGPLYWLHLKDALITGEKIDGEWVWTPHLKYQICKHFPGYCGKFVTTNDQVVCVMIPLYRPGRPSVKIYTPFPAFQGQAPCDNNWVKGKFGTVYSWAVYRQRGATVPDTHVTLEFYEPDGSLTMAYEGRKAGLRVDRHKELVISDVTGAEPVVVADLTDGDGEPLDWDLYVTPQNVDPVLMACMAACNEMLSNAQAMGAAIRKRPHMVFKM